MTANARKVKGPLRGQKVLLRQPEADDFVEFFDSVLRSRELHDRFVAPPADEVGFLEYLTKSRSDRNECFLVIETETGRIAGVVNLSEIVRGDFRSAYLGYYLFEGFTGRGLMTDAIRAVLNFAFGELCLNRVEANIQPDNLASIELVRRCGFQKEGFSRNYLRIAGAWRDHERWAILEESFNGGD